MSVERVDTIRDEAFMPLSSVLSGWVPGSFDQPWTWDDEEQDIRSRVCCCCNRPGHYQQELEAFIAEHGWTGGGVVLSDDGRVWDGHHRIVAARRLGIERIPVESPAADSGTPVEDAP